MLKIRAEQLKTLQSASDAAFVARLAQLVRATHADAPVRLPGVETTVAALTDERLREMIRHGVARARAHGLAWESSVGAFVTVMFVAAPNFDEHPPVRRVLRDPRTDPDARVERLWEATTDEDWEAVERNYDAGAWRVAAGGSPRG